MINKQKRDKGRLWKIKPEAKLQWQLTSDSLSNYFAHFQKFCFP
jgi:aspartokinase-like uncharacterized kinase